MGIIKNIIFVGFRPKINNFISINEYSFPLETGGSNKSLILDIDFLRTMFNTSLLIFDYKAKETISKGIKSTPVTLIGIIKYLLTTINKTSQSENLLIVKNTLALGLIIKIFSPFSKVIIVIEKPYKYAAWKDVSIPSWLKPIYFIASFITMLVVDKIVVDRRDHWVIKTNIANIKNKSVFLPNPIDTKIYYPNHIKVINDEKRLLYIGRLYHRQQKNPELLFKSFEMVEKKFPNIKLTFIGGAANDAQDLISNKKLLDKITFIENIPCDEVADYYRNSDLLLLPSYYEGIPNVILESLACGTPCIVTDVLEKGLIIDGVNGYTCKDFSAHEFAALIEKGFILSQDLKEKAKSLLNPVFKIENRNQNLLDLINSIK